MEVMVAFKSTTLFCALRVFLCIWVFVLQYTGRRLACSFLPSGALSTRFSLLCKISVGMIETLLIAT